MSRIYDTDDELDQLITLVSNWKRWGEQDQLGTLNFITSEVVTSASSLVTIGRTVSLARETTVEPDYSDEQYQYEQYKMHSDTSHSSDFVGLMFHGLKFTHLDGLCHIFTADQKMYNGYDIAHIKETGTGQLGVEHIAKNGIVGRGILVDVAKYKGRKLKPGEIIHLEDLQQTLISQNIKLHSGDILLIRAGTGIKNTLQTMSGLHPEVIPWLYENEISLIGSDGGNDYLPNNYSRYFMPLHQILIPHMGMPLIDNAELEELSRVCQEENRWEFMLVLAPWNLIGVSGSLINPLAIF